VIARESPRGVTLITNGIDPPDTPIDPGVVKLPVGPDTFVAMFTVSTAPTVRCSRCWSGGPAGVRYPHHIALVGDGDRRAS